VKTIIRNAHVLTMDAADTEHRRATVSVEAGVISAVDPFNAPIPPDAHTREIDGAGLLLMPGLVNAHFHSSVNHLKGSLDSLPLEIFMLYESPAEGVAVGARAAYVRTMLGALEMLKCGITTVLDDAFFVPSSHSTSPTCRRSTSYRFWVISCRHTCEPVPPLRRR
jgi:5-methylthioadenosine/S-adenosylhomocysteine deaminase